MWSNGDRSGASMNLDGIHYMCVNTTGSNALHRTGYTCDKHMHGDNKTPQHGMHVYVSSANGA